MHCLHFYRLWELISINYGNIIPSQDENVNIQIIKIKLKGYQNQIVK